MKFPVQLIARIPGSIPGPPSRTSELLQLGASSEVTFGKANLDSTRDQ